MRPPRTGGEGNFPDRVRRVGAAVLRSVSMLGLRAKLAQAAVLALFAACGNTESDEPDALAGAGGAGMATGGNGASASEIRVCRAGVGESSTNPLDERNQFQGSNGSFEDHCDETGQLLQYVCATRVPCSGPSCVPDATVPYNTGEVGSYTVDCGCVAGACAP